MPRFRTGTDDFKKLRDAGGYFVDKSMFIKEVIDANDVTLLPRPRRFGKTLNMTMLRYFFENSAEDRGYLFDGLEITQHPEYMRHQGQYPVIYLSLKDVKGGCWEEARTQLAAKLAQLFYEHKEIADSLEDARSARFQAILKECSDNAAMKMSLKELIYHLYSYHGKPAVVLIDEYDSPIIEAWKKGYYAQMIDFMRSWLGGGLKHENAHALYRAVVTGILRVARESIFSGLNNLDVASMLQPGPFADKFGFTQPELDKIVVDFGLPELAEPMREWYNGYDFGGHTIYNPWSVINCVSSHPNPIGPYWLNTASNVLVHEELGHGGLELKRDLEKLLAGAELRYPINENTIFDDIGRDPKNIWSFLVFSGYLKASDPQRDPDTLDVVYRLEIPNLEIMGVYRSFIERYFRTNLDGLEVRRLLEALKTDDHPEFERRLQEMVRAVFSFYDVAKHPEAVYHSFMLGLLANLFGSYRIQSNVESGYGRADILMIPKRPGLTGKVIEFKSIQPDGDLDQAAAAALEQIEANTYDARLLEAGVAPEHIRKLAIVVSGKHVKVQPASLY